MDWLSYTVAWEHLRGDYWTVQTDVPNEASRTFGLPYQWTLCKPMHGYRRCYTNDEVRGATLMASLPDDPMGVHLQLSGSALRVLDMASVVGRCVTLKGKPSRCDLALDVYGEAPVQAVKDAYLNGEAVTRAKQHAYIESLTGETFYVGSRTSDQYLRVYNKGAQTGTSDRWTRVEIECKRGHAKHAFQEWALHAENSVRGKIIPFCDFPTVAWWREAMSGALTIDSIPKEEKRRNTREWLLKACVPALARECDQDPSFLTSFVDQVMNRMGKGR